MPGEEFAGRRVGVLDGLAAPIPEQPVDHRVFAIDDLHDHLGPEPRQPGDEVGERHVAADDDMVGEGEAEDEVRGAAVRQRAALQAPPSEARRRVGNVRHERQDRPPVLRLEAVVQAVDHQVIGVEGQHVVGAVGRHPGVDPSVAADVPRQPPAAVADRALVERALPRAVGVVVGQRPLVVGPGRLRRRPA